MKKLLSLFLLMFVFVLVGCSSETSAVSTTTKERTTTEAITTQISTTTSIITKENTTEVITTTTIPMTTTIITTTKKTLEGSPIANGIWHRPNVLGTENDLDGIRNTLDIFKRCGINIVYLETIYHGMAMYKSNLLPYYKGFSGNKYGDYKDYLSAFVAEAELRGIEVHAWVEDFYIGIETGELANNHPDWLLTDAKGSLQQTEGGGYYFLDPANPEVTDFLINVYYELLMKNSGIKGLNLDYIRYPVSSKSDDTGYTEYAMKDFLNSINYTITDETKLLETFKSVVSSRYNDWVKYRADKVTKFVKDIREMTNKYFSNIILSTAIFPNMSEAYNTKKQDFTKWIENGYIDVCTPMAYYDDTSTLTYYLKEMMKQADNVYFYTGISCIYHSLSNTKVTEQIDKCIELSDGFVIFGSQKLLNNSSYISLLENKFKNEKYYLPHLDR